MDHHNQIHNDIKPQNYLAKFLNSDNDLSCIEIVLTDFGLAGADSKGGTPIFASPECLADASRKDKSSDIFSLGRVFFFMILPKEHFLEFLFVPVAKGRKVKITELIEKEPILSFISKMVQIEKRLDLPAIRTKLQSVEQLMSLTGVAEISEIIQKSTFIYIGKISDFQHSIHIF